MSKAKITFANPHTSTVTLDDCIEQLAKYTSDIDDDLPIISLTISKTDNPKTYTITTSLYLSDGTVTDLQSDRSTLKAISRSTTRLTHLAIQHQDIKRQTGSYIRNIKKSFNGESRL